MTGSGAGGTANARVPPSLLAPSPLSAGQDKQQVVEEEEQQQQQALHYPHDWHCPKCKTLVFGTQTA